MAEFFFRFKIRYKNFFWPKIIFLIWMDGDEGDVTLTGIQVATPIGGNKRKVLAGSEREAAAAHLKDLAISMI